MKYNYKDFEATMNGTEKQISYADKLFRDAFDGVRCYIEACEDDVAEILSDKAGIAQLCEEGYFGSKTAEQIDAACVMKALLESYKDVEGMEKSEVEKCVKFAACIGETDAGKIIDTLKKTAYTLDDYKRDRERHDKEFAKFN